MFRLLKGIHSYKEPKRTLFTHNNFTVLLDDWMIQVVLLIHKSLYKCLLCSAYARLALFNGFCHALRCLARSHPTFNNTGKTTAL